jgi:hypothetical protein
VSLPHFAESAVRAYKVMMTPPMGPVAITIDTELQDEQIPAGVDLRIPKLSLSAPPAGDAPPLPRLPRCWWRPKIQC